jgi:hypothetical protein
VPSPEARALSLQQQYALELIAAQAGMVAGSMMYQASQSTSLAEAQQMADEWSALLAGAMIAVAATRVGYLQRFATAEGAPLFDVPMHVLRPTVQDVLVGGRGSPIPPPRGVGSELPTMPQVPLRIPSSQGAMWSTLAQLDADLKEEKPDAFGIASRRIVDYTESTVTATPDYVDAMLLGPNKAIMALRRVTHPGACDRCMKAAGALVFKTSPRLRHPQCRCSFEPVLVGDPEYSARLARYAANAQFNDPGPYARDRRYRGRQQLAALEQRVSSEFAQDVWSQFLRDEQARLAKIVTAVPSTQYRNWAVMTSAKITENVPSGGDWLPEIVRN